MTRFVAVVSTRLTCPLCVSSKQKENQKIIQQKRKVRTWEWIGNCFGPTRRQHRRRSIQYLNVFNFIISIFFYFERTNRLFFFTSFFGLVVGELLKLILLTSIGLCDDDDAEVIVDDVDVGGGIIVNLGAEFRLCF